MLIPDAVSDPRSVAMLHIVATAPSVVRTPLIPEATRAFRKAAPRCDLDCLPNAARKASVGVALSTSFALSAG